MIDRDGATRASVPEHQVAHHVLTHSGRSIAVELSNDGDGRDPFPAAQIDALVAKKMGYKKTYAVTGQTYPRKFDAQVLAVLSGIAQSLSKFATDIRLLQHLKEVEEPFEKTQIGSSAMA